MTDDPATGRQNFAARRYGWVERGEKMQHSPYSSIDCILDATAQIISRNRKGDATIHEISRVSGLNSALIKYYFGNKEGLLLSLLARDAKAEMPALARLVISDHTALEKLEIHLRAMVDVYYRRPYLNKLIHTVVEGGSAQSSGQIKDMFFDPIVAAYKAIIAQGQRERTLPELDPKFLVYATSGAAENIFHSTYTPRDRALGVSEDVKERYKNFMIGLFLRGLAADSSK